MKVDINFAVEFLKSNDNFTIICHVNPDGDTLGSGYALCGALHLMGKRARIICDDKPSPRFDFLLETLNPKLSEFPENAEETVVTVDAADLDLLGSIREKYATFELCIDHHISHRDFAVNTLLDTSAAACAEIVWGIVKELLPENELKSSVTGSAIAGAIYTGVSTDTGCFKYSNTSAKSHMIAAELMQYGFDVVKINYIMFEMKTRERVILEQQALAGIEYFFAGRCAVIVLTAAMLEGIDPEDASNVSSLPKQIEGVQAGVVIKEKGKGVWKVSVRTSSSVDARAVCATLGGGGHLRAAGCTLTGDFETVKKTILNETEKQL